MESTRLDGTVLLTGVYAVRMEGANPFAVRTLFFRLLDILNCHCRERKLKSWQVQAQLVNLQYVASWKAESNK